ncbi:UDP-N-acetylglucosamine 2-epimerase, partial [Acinetobacter baumannii]
MMMSIASALREIAAYLPLAFPLHPRTRNNLEKFGIDLGPNITLLGPQAYMSFLDLWKDATLTLTDSGGLQEETTALGVP